MKLTMTLMVRDEADIVGAMIRHHAAQGVDAFIVTDNGSVDGTTQILEELAHELPIRLLHDFEHRKQQGETVTRMARSAAEDGATWVLNADADEFWVAADPELTLRDAFERIDVGLGSFPVPVYDMIGDPAEAGSGLQRLVYRDLRPVARMQELGINDHATHDAAHVGDPEVTVSQGNHFVSIPSQGTPPPGVAVEVLHFPWRSWSQFGGKVERSGLAYESSPHLEPSANHHGMRDYRRLRDGVLLASYVARHPDRAELEAGLASGALVEDLRISLSVSSPVDDVPLPADSVALERALWARLQPIERRLIGLENDHRRESDDARGLRHELELRRNELDETRARLERELSGERAALAAAETELAAVRAELTAMHARRMVRLADRLAGVVRRGPR
ncbi:glycosyltransferase family 2 protein [Agromyces silvae]|uniref:glycosyltransferase family 2 protein n=1 Tax=Agromyces silvae TaxID=3388266 RepID=UPI00280B735F|nr:glycosyltransferase family 2 protein [Agromyces protaetiae]